MQTQPLYKASEKKASNLAVNLFQFVLVVQVEQGAGGLAPKISYRYPPVSEDGKAGQKDNSMLASIPQFCFPDLEKLKPVKKYSSETFSFVLTDLDGTKKFGYCRRMLADGDGARFPEVYCIVSEMLGFAFPSPFLFLALLFDPTPCSLPIRQWVI